MAMEYFPCYDSYLAKTRSLSDQELGRLFRALMTYHATGEPQQLAGRESMAYDFIVDDIDRANKAYDEKCQKAKSNISKRYTEATDVYGGIPTNTDVYESYQSEDKSKSKDKSNTLKKSNARDAFAEFANGNDLLLKTLKDFEAMRNKIKKPLTDRAKETLLSKLKTYPEEQWVPILEQSIFHSWQGIFDLKNTSSARLQSQSGNRQLDEDERRAIMAMMEE